MAEPRWESVTFTAMLDVGTFGHEPTGDDIAYLLRMGGIDADVATVVPTVPLADVLSRLSEIQGRFDRLVDDCAEATDDLSMIAIEVKKQGGQ